MGALTTTDPDFMLSLARGLTVMTAFARHGPRLTIGELARLTSLSRSATRRCVHTLEVLGYVSEANGAFMVTPMVLSLASNYLAAASSAFGAASIAHLAQPALDRVVAELHESSSLALLDGDDIVYVARAAAGRILSVELAVGSRLPAACTSMGRVLLCHLDDRLLARYLDRVKLRAYTPRTIVDKAVFKAELKRVRTSGFAIVDEELELGLRSIAVPVTRQDGSVVAAVNAGVHVARAGTATLRREFLPVLRRTANEISAALGGA